MKTASCFSRSALFVALSSTMSIGTTECLSFDIPADVRQTVDDILSYRDEIHFIGSSLEDVATHKPLPTPDATPHWMLFASHVEEARKTIEALRIPINYNPADYQVRLGDLLACFSRGHAIETLDKFAQQLDEEAADGQQLSKALSNAQTANASSIEYLDSAIKVYETVAGLPEIGNFAALNWYDMKLHVGPALQAIKTEIATKRAEIDTTISKITKGSENLRSNIDQFSHNQCDISGGYHVKHGNTEYNVYISYVRGTYYCNGSYSCRIDRVDTYNHILLFNVSRGQGVDYLSMYFSSDFRFLSGTTKWGCCTVTPVRMNRL